MLFVKNMMFLDGATATLAPDLDILGEMAQIYAYFQQHYGEQIAIQLGLDPNERVDFDLDAVKAGFRLGEEYGDHAHLRAGEGAARDDPQAHARPLRRGVRAPRGSARGWRGSSRPAPRRAAPSSGRAGRRPAGSSGSRCPPGRTRTSASVAASVHLRPSPSATRRNSTVGSTQSCSCVTTSQSSWCRAASRSAQARTAYSNTWWASRGSDGRGGSTSQCCCA